jgi:hypothetical protein
MNNNKINNAYFIYFLLITFFGALFFGNTNLHIIKYGGIYEKLYHNRKNIAIFLSIIYATIRLIYYNDNLKIKKQYLFIVYFMMSMLFIPIYINVVGDSLFNYFINKDFNWTKNERVLVLDKQIHQSRGHSEYSIKLNLQKDTFYYFTNRKIFDKIKINDSLKIKYHVLNNGTVFYNRNNFLNNM